MSNLDITMRHGELSRDLEQFVTTKVARVQKYLRGTPRIEFVVDREHELFRCEMIVHASRRGAHLVAHDTHDDVMSCVDLVVEKMERQLVKFIDRRKDHHRGRRGVDGADSGTPSGDEEEPSYEEIVKRELKD